MKYFSMFSGIGGFELGIQNAIKDWEREGQERTRSLQHIPSRRNMADLSKQSRNWPICVGYSEIDKYAIKVYERQFNGHTNYGDATTINAKELPDFDLLVGGFPCQAFSVAGKRAGFNDTRGTLFFDIARILAEKRPRHLVLENVKGLLSHDSGKTFQTILGVLSDLGYRVEWQVLNSKNFGVPQNRERVYIVGHLGGKCGRKVFPIIGTSIKDIEQLNQPKHSNDRVYGTDGIAPTLNTMQGGNRRPFIAAQVRERLAVTRPNEKDIGITFHKNGDVRPHRLDKSKSGISELAINYEANVSNTVTSSHEPKVYTATNARIRRLTPVECERLQGFPDNWTKEGKNNKRIHVGAKVYTNAEYPEIMSDSQRYKMCGNAVTTSVVQAVIENLKCL